MDQSKSNDDLYTTIHKSESYGIRSNFFGIEIKVASSNLTDFNTSAIKNAVYLAVEQISNEIKAEAIKHNPGFNEEIKRNHELVNIFNNPIFVEEIQNEYCKDWCCRHLPWFEVTTYVGRIKIGWRKRVIEIDWSDTHGTAKARNIFSNEDTTKGEKFIHAWSIDDAKRYVDAIINSAPINQMKNKEGK